MKFTVRPYLLKRRTKPNGEIPIYIRITKDRNYSLLSTDVSIEKKYWDPGTKYGQQVWIKDGKNGHPSAKALNQQIRNKLNEIHEVISQAGDNISRKQVVKLVQNENRDTVYEYGIEVAEKLQDEGKYHPYKQTKAAVSKFKEFAGNVRFNEVTPQMLNDFQHWMKTELENHPNTIVKTISRLKAVIKEAYQNDVTTNMPFNDPKFKRVKSVETKKQALSIDQIETIENLNLTGELWHVRNYFMFSFWNAGIRFTDLALLKWKNIQDGRLRYQMGKNKKQKDILLLPEAKEILNHYRIEDPKPDDFIFPIIKQKNLTETGLRRKAASQNTLTNRDLKKIQEKAGIQTNISFHISRHSFARWAKSNDMTTDFIGKALAHTKRATTERYLDSLEEYNIDDQMQKLAQSRRS